MPLRTLSEKYWQPAVAAGLLLLLALTWLAFAPGLGGILIFDDIPNLQPWKDIGDIDNLHKALTFVASGADFPGRPLSLLSFLIDDQSWTPDIFALKRSNLAIHLINTCLLFWLCLQLLRLLLPTASARRQALLSLFTAAVWSLHPLQVSNVSYVVQRMNLLSTMLELAGLLLFVQGRAQLATAPRRALLLCTAAIAIFMPLAILAKENGLLLCAFALLVEAFCFDSAAPRWWRHWKQVFLWGPLALFLLYCALHYRGFTTGFETRPFNAWERLLTQGPVLTDYLGKLLLPRLHGNGLYFDNFPISHSLLAPAGTLWSWLLLGALLALAWWLRQRQPLLAFGIFFYFCGHLMESTLLPLELYYEHRNYLPQAGLWMALAGLLSLANGNRLRFALDVFAVLLLTLLLVLTRHNAALWSDPDAQTAVWYHDNPGSQRSALAYANLLLQRRDFAALDQVLQDGQRYHPHNLAFVVSQRFVDCYWRNQPTRFDDLPALALHADYEIASILMLEQMRSIYTDHAADFSDPAGCRPATPQQIANIYLALLKNPPFAGSRVRPRLFEYSADAAIASRHLDEAMFYYDEAFASLPLAIYPYRQALLLDSAGLADQALPYLDKAEAALTPRQRLLYPDIAQRIRDLRLLLQHHSARSPR